MAKGKNQHVVPVKNQGWGVVGEGNERKTAIVPTKKEAEKIGREIAKNQKSEVLIHDKNGKIKERDSYGKDPYPPKG